MNLAWIIAPIETLRYQVTIAVITIAVITIAAAIILATLIAKALRVATQATPIATNVKTAPMIIVKT